MRARNSLLIDVLPPALTLRQCDARVSIHAICSPLGSCAMKDDSLLIDILPPTLTLWQCDALSLIHTIITARSKEKQMGV